jgi:FkbM family methyltransferase
MEHQIRAAARQLLPPTLRRPLGNVGGFVLHRCVRPVQGLLFDLSGGRFKADGCVFEIPRDLTTRTYRSCFWSSEYEREERELIRRFILPQDRVLELGACIGIVSCVTNRLLADRTKHLVVEANPLLVPWLERNRNLNQAGFKIENCALSDRAEVTFYIHPKFIVGGTSEQPTDRPVTVRGRGLEELHREFGPFNAMIMDVEGSEIHALPISEKLLREYRLVIVELHSYAIGEEGVNRCRASLKAAGLRLAGQAGLTEAWVRD